MRPVMIALVLTAAAAAPAWAKGKVGGGTPQAASPCDAACQEAERKKQQEAEAAMADAPLVVPVGDGGGKKGGATGSTPSQPSASTPTPRGAPPVASASLSGPPTPSGPVGGMTPDVSARDVTLTPPPQPIPLPNPTAKPR